MSSHAGCCQHRPKYLHKKWGLMPCWSHASWFFLLFCFFPPTVRQEYSTQSGVLTGFKHTHTPDHHLIPITTHLDMAQNPAGVIQMIFVVCVCVGQSCVWQLRASRGPWCAAEEKRFAGWLCAAAPSRTHQFCTEGKCAWRRQSSWSDVLIHFISNEALRNTEEKGLKF